MAHPFYKTIRT